MFCLCHCIFRSTWAHLNTKSLRLTFAWSIKSCRAHLPNLNSSFVLEIQPSTLQKTKPKKITALMRTSCKFLLALSLHNMLSGCDGLAPLQTPSLLSSETPLMSLLEIPLSVISPLFIESYCLPRANSLLRFQR